MTIAPGESLLLGRKGTALRDGRDHNNTRPAFNRYGETAGWLYEPGQNNAGVNLLEL